MFSLPSETARPPDLSFGPKSNLTTTGLPQSKIVAGGSSVDIVDDAWGLLQRLSQDVGGGGFMLIAMTIVAFGLSFLFTAQTAIRSTITTT